MPYLYVSLPRVGMGRAVAILSLGELTSPSMLRSGLVLRSVSWSAAEASLRRLDDIEEPEELLRADGEDLAGGTCHVAASATDFCMLSWVTGGESGSRKLGTSGRCVGSFGDAALGDAGVFLSPRAKDACVMVDPLPLELPESWLRDAIFLTLGIWAIVIGSEGVSARGSWDRRGPSSLAVSSPSSDELDDSSCE